MATEFPEKYTDPLYASLDAQTEKKLGLPVGLLSSVREKGERTDHSRTNELKTFGVYQFIPATRKAILDKYGVDVTLSPENASEGAGLLLQEGLKRNNGDPAQAVGEYIGGLDRKAWGKTTNAYINRVMSGQQSTKLDALSSGFAKFMAANPATPEAAAAPTPEAAPDQRIDSLASGFGSWLESQGAAQTEAAKTPEKGFLAGVGESITGKERRVASTEALPDWAGMPELNQLSLASAKTGLGTLMSNPTETAQIIKSNFPGVEVSQDEKGNFLLKSSVDGQTYAVKPGFRPSDIPRAGANIAAFTPAGRATSILGAAGATGATQAAIEASQAATGGEFSGGDVIAATAAGGAIPLITRGLSTGKAAVTDRLKGAAAPGAAPTAQAVEGAMAGAPRPVPAAPVAQSAAPVVPAAAPAALAAPELAQVTRRAAEGGIGSGRAAQVLAGQAMPDEKALQAARRLGIEQHLQPDHVTTNQAYRELAQAIKSVPGSQARSQEVVGLAEVAKRADDLIGELGGTTDISTLNTTLKGRMQSTIATLDKKAEDLYGQVNKAIPPKTTAPATSTLQFLTQHADELGGASRLLPTERKLLSSLSGEEGDITYAFLDQTRKQIGQAMRKSTGPYADTESGLLKRLYSSLSDDQQAIAEAAGVGDLFKAAKSSVAVRKGIEDDTIALFGKALDGSFAGNLSGAVRALPKGDSEKLVRLLKSIPEDQRKEAMASGLLSAFRNASTQGPINFNSYAKWYEGLLRNKQAHTAVMTNLPPEARKQLSDLYRVSKGVSQATRERITTGRIQAVSEELRNADAVAEKIYDFARKNVVAAGAGTAASAVLGPGIGGAIGAALAKGGTREPAIKAADALISSPEFAKLIQQGGQKEAVRRFAHSPAFNKYVRALGNPREMSNREKWVLQVIQGRTQTQD